jgi:hypothetical protein
VRSTSIWLGRSAAILEARFPVPDVLKHARENLRPARTRGLAPAARLGFALLAIPVAGVGAPAPARAEGPTVLERIVSVKRSPEGTSARLIDTPILQILRAEEERFEGGQREQVRVASSRLFSVFQRDTSTAASGTLGRTQAESRFASLLGASLLEWSSDKEHPITGEERISESEWRLLTLPKLGALFARKKTAAGSAYEVLYFLHFGAR